MRFDLTMVSELCDAVGLVCVRRSADEVDVHIADGITLQFQNVATESVGNDGERTVDRDDNLIGFEGTPWHTHDGLMFSDRRGFSIELTYLDVVSGLADGAVLICEHWLRGELADRQLVHRDFVDEFRHLQDGEEIRIRAVARKRDASLRRSRGA